MTAKAAGCGAQQRRTEAPFSLLLMLLMLLLLLRRICLCMFLRRGLRAVVRRGLALALFLLWRVRRLAAVVRGIPGVSALLVAVASWLSASRGSAVRGCVAGLLSVLRGRRGVWGRRGLSWVLRDVTLLRARN